MVSQLDSAFNYNDLHGLNSVKQAARKDDPEALKVVAQQFESMFINLVLKSMREATDVMASDLFNSNETRFYQDMYDQQLSLSVSQNGGYGLADTLYDQLLAQLPKPANDLSRIQIQPLANNIRPILPAQPPARVHQMDSHGFLLGKTPADFIEQLLPYATEAAQNLGIEPQMLLAQAALETGWGQHMIQTEQGQPSYNFFGIKAHRDWQGDTAETLTHEYMDGQRINIKDNFRAYPNPAAAFADYVDFLTTHPRYEKALNSTANSEDFIKELQAAGYATDPNYAEKITAIAKRINSANNA